MTDAETEVYIMLILCGRYEEAETFLYEHEKEEG